MIEIVSESDSMQSLLQLAQRYARSCALGAPDRLVVRVSGDFPTQEESFDDLDGATRLTLEHSGFQAGPEMESHKEAWSSYLYNLRAYLLQR